MHISLRNKSTVYTLTTDIFHQLYNRHLPYIACISPGMPLIKEYLDWQSPAISHEIPAAIFNNEHYQAKILTRVDYQNIIRRKLFTTLVWLRKLETIFYIGVNAELWWALMNIYTSRIPPELALEG